MVHDIKESENTYSTSSVVLLGAFHLSGSGGILFIWYSNVFIFSIQFFGLISLSFNNIINILDYFIPVSTYCFNLVYYGMYVFSAMNRLTIMPLCH